MAAQELGPAAIQGDGMIEVQSSNPAEANASATDRETVSLAWIFAVLLLHRRTILALGATGFVLSIAFASSKPRTFTSSFSFTPQTSQDQSRSGLATLAGQFGLAVPSSGQNPQLYADLLKTRGVLLPIVRERFVVESESRQTLPLSEFFGIRGQDPRVVEELTLRTLRDRVIASSAATRTTGVIAASVRTKSAQVSYDIAQRLIAGLNQFNLATRKSQAGEERRFAEQRLSAAKIALRQAEDALQRFLAANRQFATASELAFQRERLQREVTLQQQVVMGLAQQYEEARIREVRDTPVLTVIEQPVLAALADPRGRAVTTLLGTLAGLTLAVAWALMREGWKRQRHAEERDPSYGLLDHEWEAVRRRFRKS